MGSVNLDLENIAFKVNLIDCYKELRETNTHEQAMRAIRETWALGTSEVEDVLKEAGVFKIIIVSDRLKK